MIEFDMRETAAPRARTGELTIKDKSNRTPMYLANLIRKSDRKNLVRTINQLNRKNEALLPNVGGVLVESQLAPEVLGGLEDVTQIDLTGEEKDFTNLRSVLDKLGRYLIIDPNTDRLFYSNYRENMTAIRQHLPNEVLSICQDLNDDENEDVDHRVAYNRFRENVVSGELVQQMLNLQNKFGADIHLSPYYAIGHETLADDLDQNINLIKIANELSDEAGTVCVIAVRKSVLSLEYTRENGQLHPPEEWIEIINKYRELNPDLIFLKATNVETDPDKLDKTDSEGIFDFFELLKRFMNVPTIFIGLDEFAYILMAQGLDGFTHPLYKNPYRQPKRGNTNNGANHRKFLIPRKWEWEKFDKLESLGCNGPFCNEFNGTTHPSDIDLPDQDELRKSHWFWLRDEQLSQISEAIAKDEIRPGLVDMCSDSEWKKNLTRFLDAA